MQNWWGAASAVTVVVLTPRGPRSADRVPGQHGLQSSTSPDPRREQNPRFLMGRLLLSVTGRVALLLAVLSRAVAAEYTPRPTLDDLLRADYVAVGRFVGEDEAARFVPGQVLWGSAGVVDDLRKKDELRLRVEADGKLRVWVGATGRWFSSYTVDATQQAIWFFLKERSHPRIAIQPVELTADFSALHRGEKPSTAFRLLQGLDYDMRRDALEELFAGREEDVLVALHRIALNPESLAAGDAVEVLIQTRLLEARLFWGRWTDHPAGQDLQDLLQQRDADRVARELRRAAAAEKRPPLLVHLLYCAREDVDLNIQHLNHAAEGVRRRALGNLYGCLLRMARQPGLASQTEALALRLLPLLEERRELETSAGARLTLDKMLEEQRGVPWVLRVPTTDEPLPAYSEAEERKYVVEQLTSHSQHGFARESAGQEITEHFFVEGFEQLKAAAVSPNFNQFTVYEGMGYVRHPLVFAYLVEHAKVVDAGDGTFPATLCAIGIQNDERSFDVLKELIESRVNTSGVYAAQGACDALGHLRDPRALTLLKDLEGVLTEDSAGNYLRARLRHGDSWAVGKLLAALREREPGHSADLIRTLLLADTPEVTEVLRQHVRDAWPARWESFGSANVGWCLGMQNYAGDSRRTTALGEVARRDPRWLAGLALQKMESPRLSARICGAYVFRGMTGRSFDFRPEAFASERTTPLKALQGWWAKHQNETREEWLLSYFRENGFTMTRLHDKDSLPVLVQALPADSFTHGLAVEQIPIITGKYFGHYARPTLQYEDWGTVRIGGGGYWGQERMTSRVTGWLAARKVISEGR